MTKANRKQKEEGTEARHKLQGQGHASSELSRYAPPTNALHPPKIASEAMEEASDIYELEEAGLKLTKIHLPLPPVCWD